MKYKNEDQIKKALKVDSLENLSQEQNSKFAEMMPQMDKDVRMKIIDQFPDFRLFANDTLNSFERMYLKTADSINESQKSVHIGFADLRRIIEKQLEKDKITFEEKKYFIDTLLELNDRELQQASEHRKFFSDSLKQGALIAVGVVVSGLAVLGLVKLNNNDKK